MATYNTYDHIVNGYEIDDSNKEQELKSIMSGMVWQEIEQTEQSISYARHELSHAGIDCYYDYGADYYFFTDSDSDSDCSDTQQ